MKEADVSTAAIESRYWEHVKRCTTCSSFPGRVYFRGCRTGRILSDAFYGAWLQEHDQQPRRLAFTKKRERWIPGTESIDPAALVDLIVGRKKIEL